MKISKKVVITILSIVAIFGIAIWGLYSGKFCSEAFHLRGKEAHQIELTNNMREFVKKYEGQPIESIPKPDFSFAYECPICGYSELDKSAKK